MLAAMVPHDAHKHSLGMRLSWHFARFSETTMDLRYTLI